METEENIVNINEIDLNCEQIGKGVIHPLAFPEIESALKRHEGNS